MNQQHKQQVQQRQPQQVHQPPQQQVFQRRHQSFREPNRNPNNNQNQIVNNYNNNPQHYSSQSNLSQADFRTSTRSLNQTPSECGSTSSRRSSRSRRYRRNRNRTTDVTDRSCSPGTLSGRSSQMSQRGMGDRQPSNPVRSTNPFFRANSFQRTESFQRTDSYQRADSMSPSMMARRDSIDQYSSLPVSMEIVPLPKDIPNSFVS